MLKCTASWVFISISICFAIVQMSLHKLNYTINQFIMVAFYTTAFVAVNEITNCKYVIVISVLYGLSILSQLGFINGHNILRGDGRSTYRYI
jgi:hypothetical protein